MTPTVTIRPFDGSDADYEAAAAVGNAIYPERLTSPNELRSRDHHSDPAKYFLGRWLAYDAAGAVVGSAVARHLSWAFDPDRYFFWAGVKPDRRGQGVGRALYSQVTGALQERGAAELWTATEETFTDALAFLARRGFEEKAREWESRLAVPAFDPAPYTPLLQRLAGEGITFTTLADLQQHASNWLQVIYDLDTLLIADIPMPYPFTHPSLEEYAHEVVNDPGFLPEGYFLARDGDQCVGLSFLERRELRPDSLEHGFTGVRREYRGRGIATALKLKTIEYAHTHGYREIVTGNSTLNAPMLAINQKLGFVRQPAKVEFVKRLA